MDPAVNERTDFRRRNNRRSCTFKLIFLIQLSADKAYSKVIPEMGSQDPERAAIDPIVLLMDGTRTRQGRPRQYLPSVQSVERSRV